MTGALAALLTTAGLVMLGLNSGLVGTAALLRQRLAHHHTLSQPCQTPSTDRFSAIPQPPTSIDSCSSAAHFRSLNR